MVETRANPESKNIKGADFLCPNIDFGWPEKSTQTLVGDTLVGKIQRILKNYTSIA